MFFKSLLRVGFLTAIGCIVLVSLSLAIGGCGRGSEEKEMPVRIVQEDSQRSGVTAPVLLEAETLLAQGDAETVTPEPPRQVSYEEAETAFMERRYDDALELFTRYTECREMNPWGHYMLGLSAWKAGENETAQLAFEQALSLDPSHVKSRLNLSRVLLDMNDPAAALLQLDEAVAADSGSHEAYRLQGRAHHQLGQNGEAIAAYRRAIEIDNEDAWSMNNLALIYIEEERFEAALPPLARAIELRDDIALFYNNLGMALERTGRIRAAENAYRTATDIDAIYERAVDNLARIELVAEETGIEPVDLTALALRFTEEIASWNAPATSQEPAVVMQPEMKPFVSSAADSSGDGRTP